MLNRMIAPLVAVALLTAACGDSEESTDAAGSKPSGDPISVGVIVPLTGASAKTAEQMVNAAKLAAAEVNADGGVDGRPLELKIYDDELKPENAAREAQRAVTRDQVTAIIGAQSSGEATSIREVVERAKVPFITSSGTAESITRDALFTYRIAPLLTDYATSVVDMATAVGLKSPAVLNDSGGAGLLLKDIFIKHAAAVGVKFAGEPVEFPLNGTDLSAQVTAAARQNPDGLLLGGSAGGDHGLIAKTMLEQGMNVPLFGFSPILVEDAIAIAGAGYSELPGVYGLQNLDQEKATFQTFRAAYFEEHGETDLTEHPAQTYDAVKVLAQALEQSKGEGGTALRDALNQTSAYEGASGREGAMIEFSEERHDGFQGDYLVAYKYDGKGFAQADLEF